VDEGIYWLNCVDIVLTAGAVDNFEKQAPVLLAPSIFYPLITLELKFKEFC
jgi:hypothetical protein